MTPERDRANDEFNRISYVLNNLDLNEFYRSTAGSLSLNRFKSEIGKIILILDQARDILKQIPDKTLGKLNVFGSDFYNLILKIGEYSYDDFAANRSTIINDIDLILERFRNIWSEFSYLIIDYRLESYIKKVDGFDSAKISLDDTKTLYDQLLKTAESQIEEAKIQKKEYEDANKRFSEKYDPVITKAEILFNSAQFKAISKSYKKSSEFWFKAIIGSVLLLVGTLFILLCCFSMDLHYIIHYAELGKNSIDKLVTFEIIKNISFRLICISISTFIVGFTVKNYNNCKHNETIYYHKASSLNAALQLIDKVKTDDGKDNLMTQASLAIFSHQPTGYNSKGTENIPLGIIEHVKTLVSQSDEKKE